MNKLLCLAAIYNEKIAQNDRTVSDGCQLGTAALPHLSR